MLFSVEKDLCIWYNKYMIDLKRKKLFLLDMDGTLYLDDRLFDGAAELLDAIVKKGGRYVFLTNNSSKGVSSYVEKMKKLGINTSGEDYLTSVDALAVFLKRKYGESACSVKIYIMGTRSFRQQMKNEGFTITDRLEDDIELLVIGFDRELTFSKLEDACILLGRGVDYFATNPDWVCPTSYGFVPDCGSFAFMLEKATGRKPYFIGKPQPDMALLAMEKYGCSRDETVIVGDRLYTDIACGNNAGIDAAFVLSGEGRASDICSGSAVPDGIYKGIWEILKEIDK